MVRSYGSFHRATNGWATLLACLAVKERIGIGFTIGVASRSKSEGSGISHLYSQLWNQIRHSSKLRLESPS